MKNVFEKVKKFVKDHPVITGLTIGGISAATGVFIGYKIKEGEFDSLKLVRVYDPSYNQPIMCDVIRKTRVDDSVEGITNKCRGFFDECSGESFMFVDRKSYNTVLDWWYKAESECDRLSAYS